MKRLKKKISVIILGLLLFPTIEVSACFYQGVNYPDCQPHPKKGCCHPSGKKNCPRCIKVPLDGGLSTLLLAGLLFGVKKVSGKME